MTAAPPDTRAALRRLGLSVAAFAREIGYDKATVHRWLNGSSPTPLVVERYLALRLERVELAERLAS